MLDKGADAPLVIEVVLPDVLGIVGGGGLPVVGQDNPQPGV